jgi:hypothetical protein
MTAREIAGWAVIQTFVVMFISEAMMVEMNPHSHTGHFPLTDFLPKGYEPIIILRIRDYVPTERIKNEVLLYERVH